MSSVRRRPSVISEMPKTSSTWATAPHTGRSTAGTNSDRGVRTSASHQASAARTKPTSRTRP